MPKNNKVTKIDNVIHKQRTPSRLRIGNRKTGKSANLFSSVELQSILEENSKSKWHNHARTVLASRGAL